MFEVLIAFAVMTMILSVLLPRQTDMLARMRAVDDRALALDYAMSRLDMLHVTALQPGQTTETYRAWSVTQGVISGTLQGAQLQVMDVRIEVTDARGTLLAQIETQMIPNEQP